MRIVTPEMPIFSTLDQRTRTRKVYAFYCLGILYENGTETEAKAQRQAILDSQEPNTIQGYTLAEVRR